MFNPLMTFAGPDGPVTMGAPMSLPAGFGTAPLTQEDLDDYRRRLQEKSPTPMDAMRFSDLSMRLSRRLCHKDKEIYDMSIRLLKESPPVSAESRAVAETVVKRVESKALAADPAQVTEQRAKKERIEGLRVRLVSDKTKHGVVLTETGFVVVDDRGRRFQVKLDGETTTCSFSRTELQLLCSVCGEDAPNRCSRCTFQPYCSPACQRSDWDAHKPKCKKPAS